MATSTPAPFLTPAEGYRLWASSYDSEANPVLSLEQRMLQTLLPPLDGLDVVDIGCGTGRWLEAMQGAGARSLLGFDPSPEMLSRAKAKLGDAAALVCADYAYARLARDSADLVICTFVLSYVENPGQLLKFARSILGPGGFLFLSDLHPETCGALHWRRGVRLRGEFREVRTYQRTLPEIMAHCREANLNICAHLEPRFGDAERMLFEQNGKREYFDQIHGWPAIYLLQLAPSIRTKAPISRQPKSGNLDCLRGARLALGAAESVHGELRIIDSAVRSIHDAASAMPPTRWLTPVGDLTGYLVLPGLINAHDHLEFALFPQLGRGRYKNFLEWAEDIHRSYADEIAAHRQVPKSLRLWWGGIRNLLCGVTTVSHHNPYESAVFSQDFIIRVLKDYGWAHSLALDPIAARKKKQTPRGQPFFIHLAEGTDETSGAEIFELDRAGALDEDTVIIHGLGIGTSGGALLRAKGAGLVWCPSSNQFLFGDSMSPTDIRAFPRVALGSDSPLTAQGDLLDEVRYAHQVLRTTAAETYEYVTRQPAALLRLKKGEGTLRIGAVADLIAVRDTGRSPAETLATLSYRDVELVLLAGRVHLASPEMKHRLPEHACEGLQPLLVQGVLRWIRAPLERMFSETAKHLPGPLYLGGKQVCLAD